MFFIKRFPFRKSVIVFCILNIWIVIAWSDWQYGATYSTRALVQSYPIFLLPFTAIIERMLSTKWKFPLYVGAIYLVFVNLFQIDQYNQTVLHYRDMNAKYYSHIYLNPSPSVLDMSLLDTDEFIDDESNYKSVKIDYSQLSNQKKTKLSGGWGTPIEITRTTFNATKDNWIRIDARIKVQSGFSSSHLACKVESKQGDKQSKIRLFNPISEEGKRNNYSFYMKLSEFDSNGSIQLFIEADYAFEGTIDSWSITQLIGKAE